jgi:hypothetical protein
VFQELQSNDIAGITRFDYFGCGELTKLVDANRALLDHYGRFVGQVVFDGCGDARGSVIRVSDLDFHWFGADLVLLPEIEAVILSLDLP